MGISFVKLCRLKALNRLTSAVCVGPISAACASPKKTHCRSGWNRKRKNSLRRAATFMFRSAAAVQKRCLSSWALSKQLVKRRIICFGTSALLLALLSGNAGAQFEIPDIHFKKTPDRTRDREPPTGDVHRTGPSKEQIEQREKERRQHAEELRRRKAQKLYDDGTELYKQGDYEGAAEKFAAARSEKKCGKDWRNLRK